MLKGFGFAQLPEVPLDDDMSRRLEWLNGAKKTVDADYSSGTPNVISSNLSDDSSLEDGFPVIDGVLGRDDVIAVITGALLTHSPAKIIVLGGPGLGKTTVSVAAAQAARVADKFGCRRWFVPLDDAQDVNIANERIACRLGLPRGTSLSAIITYLELSPAVLVLDNFETLWEPTHSKVEVAHLVSRIAKARHLALIVTMRGEDTPGDIVWKKLSLGSLSGTASTSLFLRYAHNIKRSDEHLEHFIQELEGIPLALRLVAKRVGGRSDLRSLWEEWKRTGVSVAKQIGSPLNRTTSLSASIALSLASPHLSCAGRLMFSLLGQLPSGLSWQDRTAILGEFGIDGYNELLLTSLAIERSGRLTLLSPIRDYARRHSVPDKDLHIRWIRRYLDMIQRLKVNYAIFNPDELVSKEQKRVLEERSNIDAAMEYALESMPDEAWHYFQNYILNFLEMDWLLSTNLPFVFATEPAGKENKHWFYSEYKKTQQQSLSEERDRFAFYDRQKNKYIAIVLKMSRQKGFCPKGIIKSLDGRQWFTATRSPFYSYDTAEEMFEANPAQAEKVRMIFRRQIVALLIVRVTL